MVKKKQNNRPLLKNMIKLARTNKEWIRNLKINYRTERVLEKEVHAWHLELTATKFTNGR